MPLLGVLQRVTGHFRARSTLERDAPRGLPTLPGGCHGSVTAGRPGMDTQSHGLALAVLKEREAWAGDAPAAPARAPPRRYPPPRRPAAPPGRPGRRAPAAPGGREGCAPGAAAEPGHALRPRRAPAQTPHPRATPTGQGRGERPEGLGNLRRWQSPGTAASSRTAPRRGPGPRWHLGTETIPAVRHASSGTHIMRRGRHRSGSGSRSRSRALSSGPRLGAATRSVPAPAGAAAGPGEGRRRARHR